jgi:hypothetical protein
METKICSKCKEEKLFCNFNKKKHSKDGVRTTCKKCDSNEIKKWRENNKDKVKEQKKRYNKKYHQKNLDRGKTYREKNKEKTLIRSSNWRKKNPNYSTLYFQNNKDRINNNIAIRKKTDPLFKILTNCRSKINKILGLKKNNHSFKIIGCTPKELKEHLERQFVIGMSWDNYGLFGWHIDHIIPLSSAKSEEELYKLCHYSNLQPLWAKDNLVKGNRII